MAKNHFCQNWQIYPDPRAGSPLLIRLTALIYNVHLCGLIVRKTVLKELKVDYNNSLKRFMGFSWLNSVNLNIQSFREML